LKYIVGGLVIIVIGLLWGDSVFRGAFTIRSVLFDSFGVICILAGLISVYRSKKPPAPPPVG